MEEVALVSQKIAKQALEAQIDWKNIMYIHCYRPIVANREIDPSYVLHEIRTQNPRVKIYMQDILPFFPDLQFQAVIVPCMAVDEVGNRLGYGGGKYDEFLASQKDARTVGLCYEKNIYTHIDFEEHDKQMDVVLTETRCIRR